MRLVVLILAMVSAAATAAAAEPVDCAAIATASTPFQITHHDANDSSVTQIFPDRSGHSVIWLKTLNGKFVGKGEFTAGIPVTAETASIFEGKFKSSKIIYTVDGMPPMFDRRSDLTYSITSAVVYGDGSIGNATSTTSYKVTSTSRENVGPCVLDVVHGESEIVNRGTGKTSHSYSLYLPQLMAGITGHAGEPVIDEIRTTFDPMTLHP